MSTMTKCSGFLSSGISVFKQPSGSSDSFLFFRLVSNGLLMPLPDALLVKFDIARLRSMLGREAVVETGVTEGGAE